MRTCVTCKHFECSSYPWASHDWPGLSCGRGHYNSPTWERSEFINLIKIGNVCKEYKEDETWLKPAS